MKQPPLSNYLRTHRRRASLFQDDVAYLVGLRARSNVARHELKERTPRLELALSYEIVLGVPARELFSGVAEAAASKVRVRARALVARLGKLEATPEISRRLKALRFLAQ